LVYGSSISNWFLWLLRLNLGGRLRCRLSFRRSLILDRLLRGLELWIVHFSRGNALSFHGLLECFSSSFLFLSISLISQNILSTFVIAKHLLTLLSNSIEVRPQSRKQFRIEELIKWLR
jgi:hypothetical protein